jgi:prevent-host-death family protein
VSSIYTIQEAKTQLPKLVREVERGEDVVLCRGGLPVARLVAIDTGPERVERRPGRMRGRVSVPAAFDEWSDDIARELDISG